MKYRVKFKCYWYNTGAADNHSYDNTEDFDTLQEAERFKERVDKQYEGCTLERWDYKKRSKWFASVDAVEVENGFIEGYGTIMKYFPEREESL